MNDFIKELVLSVIPVILTGVIVHRITNKNNIYKSEIEIKHQKIRLINALEIILEDLEKKIDLRNTSNEIREAFNKMSVGEYYECFEELNLAPIELNKSECIKCYKEFEEENIKLQQKNHQKIKLDFLKFKELPKNLIDAKNFKILDKMENAGEEKINIQEVKKMIKSLN